MADAVIINKNVVTCYYSGVFIPENPRHLPPPCRKTFPRHLLWPSPLLHLTITLALTCQFWYGAGLYCRVDCMLTHTWSSVSRCFVTSAHRHATAALRRAAAVRPAIQTQLGTIMSRTTVTTYSSNLTISCHKFRNLQYNVLMSAMCHTVWFYNACSKHNTRIHDSKYKIFYHSCSHAAEEQKI